MARDIITELKEEGADLFNKYIKLCDFLDSNKVDKIDPKQVTLLREQKGIMKEYIFILNNRVELLKRDK